MERSKAIELLSEFKRTGFTGNMPDFSDAITAGINALKIIEEYRRATMVGKSVYIVYDKAGDPVAVELEK